jgi:hypothetical protein
MLPGVCADADGTSMEALIGGIKALVARDLHFSCHWPLADVKPSVVSIDQFNGRTQSERIVLSVCGAGSCCLGFFGHLLAGSCRKLLSDVTGRMDYLLPGPRHSADTEEIAGPKRRSRS